MNQSGTKHIRYGIALMLMLVCMSAFSFMMVTRSVKQVAYEGTAPLVDAQRDSPSATDASCGLTALCEPFYGMQFVDLDDLDKVREMGVEVIVTDLPHDGTPANWLSFLDAAQAHGIRVIPWLWPQGWAWDGTAWQIDPKARLFLQTVAGHPALFAVYALHEPYWNGCEGCGYTTATQQALYRALKAIANVPLYSEIGSVAGWTARGQATTFADGICDYCATWYYPFKDGGIYERNQLIANLTAELAVARERAPHSKIVWMMPAYEYPPDHTRIPSADEMRDLASIVYSKGVTGAWWYPWKFGDLYTDFLFNHPELYATVRSIYEGSVREVKGACCSGSQHAAFGYRPASIAVGNTVWFTSTSSTCCGPLAYAWDWGDGTAHALTANAAHQYMTVGLYTVMLSVTDTLGYTDTHAVSNAVIVSPCTPVTPIGTVSLTPGLTGCQYLPMIIKRDR